MTPDHRHIEPSWPHAPIHKLSEVGTFFITCGTYKKQHFFRGQARLAVLHRGLLSVAQEFGWHLEAWAVFSNHYHFVAHSPPQNVNANDLPVMLGKLHSQTARWINRLDNEPGRRVWHNYRESLLTIPESYFARLNYAHNNAVKHGLVGNAAMYPWCSASWFERSASLAQVKRIYGFKIDKLNVYDEFEPSNDW